ncbi:AAA family ATPase [Pararhodospirillum oryzae]|uniref:ATPase n=1 Tax=Pararhodospirillum oryzae TaxID=478448 RepID=A0A512HAU3_9PROT|nr:AAA family ATPase [Pararhodospirillum oryzae]GEO82562.1 ATPase [Pararhodospirillum oryzae]
MPILEGFRIRNYRALRDVALGRFWNQQKNPALTPLVAVIGKNGAGKTTLFDAFGFLGDCLAFGVEEACEHPERGGFGRLISAGAQGPIQFELYYREALKERPITYELSIGLHKGRPVVIEERLRQRRQGQGSGRPFSFLYLHHGRGAAWKGQAVASDLQEDDLERQDPLRATEESAEVEQVTLVDNRRLGIATLGALKDHKRIARFRTFLQGWHLSYFDPSAARGRPRAGPQKHLNVRGDNLSNVVQYMEREHKERFAKVLQRISTKIPGVRTIDTVQTEDGFLLLRFHSDGFSHPFYVGQMSDGTLKLFTYLLLLEDPDPAPFICIEEPENGLYHKLLQDLAREFRNHATGRKNASQLFITTHQPVFVDALSPDETWILEKGADGFSTIRRAGDDPLIRHLVEEGLPLGSLWYSDYLDPR